eukprot:COSAG06_NODE_51156_length_314_cov_0.600000_1_plen_71_part_10
MFADSRCANDSITMWGLCAWWFCLGYSVLLFKFELHQVRSCQLCDCELRLTAANIRLLCTDEFSDIGAVF